MLARAIRSGPTITEEIILLSVSARDATPDDCCINAAVPHPFRARQLRHGVLHLVGRVYPYSVRNLDQASSTIGGGTAILQMIDLAQTSEELLATLSIMRDLLKDSWTASEEMERIRVFVFVHPWINADVPQAASTC